MIRTLSFWRALTAECIATFLYSLLVCLMRVSSADSHPGTSQAYCGLVAGLATATLATIFLPVSGAHLNPAISLSAAIIHRVSPLRAGAYILAQSGGAIAGASVVLGLFGTAEISRYQNMGMAQFGLEFLLSFMIVLAYLRVTDEEEEQSDRNLNPAISIGLAYMTALVAYKGTVNPALALGQAFVRSKFSSLWVLWLGPVLGGCSAALCQVTPVSQFSPQCVSPLFRNTYSVNRRTSSYLSPTPRVSRGRRATMARGRRTTMLTR